MSNKNKINGWRKEKEKLLRRLNNYKKYKNKVAKTLGKFQGLHNNGIIDCDKYTEISHKYLENKIPEQYLQEIDNKIDNYKQKINTLTNRINKHTEKVAIAPLIALIMISLGLGLIFLQSEITGFTSMDIYDFGIQPIENLTVQESTQDQFIIQPTESLTTITENISTEDKLIAIIDLSKYVTDIDTPIEDLTWTYSDNNIVTIKIQNSKATFSAPETYSGTENITLTVTDSTGLSDSQQVKIIVNPKAPVISEIPDIILSKEGSLIVEEEVPTTEITITEEAEEYFGILPIEEDNITIKAASPLNSVTTAAPPNETDYAPTNTFSYGCFHDKGGGSASLVTGNWTYCAGAGCTPNLLLNGTTIGDLTGGDADGQHSTTGNSDFHINQTVTANTAGTYGLRCEATDPTGPLLKGKTVTITVTAANNPPTVDKPSILPYPAYTNDTLNCSTTVHDLDLTAIAINFSWYKGTSLNYSTMKSGLTDGAFVSDILIAELQGKDQTWNCTAFANDTKEDGLPQSNSTTINNTAPTVDSAAITPTTAYTNTTFTCAGTGAADIDGDSLTNYYEFNDTSGVLQAWSTTATFDCGTSGCDSGDKIACIHGVDDGSEFSANVTSNVVVISNLAPIIDEPSIEPDPANPTDTLNCSTIVYDLDVADTLEINFTWYRDNDYNESVLKSGLPNGSLASDVLPTGIQEEAEVWNCTAFPNDATVDGPKDDDTITISAGTIAPEIYNITNSTDWSAVSITEDSTTSLTFKYVAVDPNGAGDLDNSTAKANFTLAGEDLRENVTCANEPFNTTATTYICTIDFWYWDKSGTWKVTPYIEDKSGLAAEGSGLSKTIELGETTGVKIVPAILIWPTMSLGSSDTLATNFITINNTCNDDIAAGNVRIKAYNLTGEQNSNYYIMSGNFTANTTQDCEGTQLVENSATGILTSLITAGNHSELDNVTGQETLFFCAETIPSNIMSQAYSTNKSGLPWTIDVV